MEINDLLALTRLSMLGDWCKIKTNFNPKQLMAEIQPFSNEWKQYNPRKNINRQGLSITSFDGLLSGIPDLDSLSEYNRENQTILDNYSCNKFTEVYKNSLQLQEMLAPFKDHLLRTHFIKLNAGGFFPDHRDCYPEFENDIREQIRIIFFVNNCNTKGLKFIYDNKLLTMNNNGSAYFFNGNKSHCVFSTTNECIFVVANLKFDARLYHILTNRLDVT